MTERDLFLELRKLYPPAEYALLPQVANGTGAMANRHADALCMSLWPSRGIWLAGFEIKSFRGDWIREKKNPEKAEAISQFCNQWWIVAGGPFITAEEVPELWGLLTWDPDKKALVKTKPCKSRKAKAPTLEFIAGMLRKAQECVGPDAEMAAVRDEAFGKGLEAGKEQAGWELKELRKLKDTVRDFEKASGIKISNRWEGGQKIGETVKQVLDGTVSYHTERMRSLAETILKELNNGK